MTIEPLYPFVGISEIAQWIGVSRQRVDQLTRQKGFPDPVAKLACGQVWKRKDVRKWIEIHRVAR